MLLEYGDVQLEKSGLIPLTNNKKTQHGKIISYSGVARQGEKQSINIWATTLLLSRVSAIFRDLPTSGSNRRPIDTKERARQAAITRKLSPEDKIVHRQKKQKQQLIRRMGIDPDNNWAARYEILPGKEKVVDELVRLAKKADIIYLATDMDREGRGNRLAPAGSDWR